VAGGGTLAPLKRDKVGCGYERPRGSEGVIYESTYDAGNFAMAENKAEDGAREGEEEGGGRGKDEDREI